MNLGEHLDVFLVFTDEQIGRTVIRVFRIGNCRFLRAQEVDIQFCNFGIACAGRNTHGIDVFVGAFDRVVEAEHVVGFVHRQEVTGIVCGNRCRTVLHFIEDFVHDITLNERLLFLELDKCRFPQGGVFGVDIDALPVHGSTECVTRIVELQNLSLILLVPHQIPRTDVFLSDNAGVVNHANHTEHVRNGICIVGIVVEVFIVFVDILIIGDVFKMQREQQVFADQSLNHIVRGENDVVRSSTRTELVVHIFIGSIGRVIDFHREAVFVCEVFFKVFLEHRVDIGTALGAVGNVLTPVVDVQRDHTA